MIKFVLPILLLLFIGCGSKSTANKNPTAIILTSSTALPLEEVTLDAILSTDDDGKIVSYTWLDQEQNVLNSTRKTTWKAPSLAGDYNLSLIVTDDDGATGTSSVIIKVIQQNLKPHAVINTNIQNVTVFQEVTLDASSSYDDDGNITKYLWNHNGSTDKVTSWIPQEAGSHTLSLTVTDNNGAIGSKNILINVSALAGPFSTIQTLLSQSKLGTVTNAVYICVGDSTRVRSERDEAHRLFEEVANDLNTYNVTSYLLARGGHQLAEFNNPDLMLYPTYEDVIEKIPGTGSTTIVDMSLGINDMFAELPIAIEDVPTVTAKIKTALQEAITHILDAKPDTHILLTAPNPLLTWEQGTDIYMSSYRTYASESSYPFINFHDDVYNDYTLAQKEAMFRPLADDAGLDNVHYSNYGLSTMAQYILENILP